eukprot:scaffold2191_cov254-Pinguiococcus_pyrenoidosus.AAC.18
MPTPRSSSRRGEKGSTTARRRAAPPEAEGTHRAPYKALFRDANVGETLPHIPVTCTQVKGEDQKNVLFRDLVVPKPPGAQAALQHSQQAAAKLLLRQEGRTLVSQDFRGGAQRSASSLTPRWQLGGQEYLDGLRRLLDRLGRLNGYGSTCGTSQRARRTLLPPRRTAARARAGVAHRAELGRCGRFATSAVAGALLRGRGRAKAGVDCHGSTGTARCLGTRSCGGVTVAGNRESHGESRAARRERGQRRRNACEAAASRVGSLRVGVVAGVVQKA